MPSDEKLWRYVDGELPAAEAEAIEAAACEDAALARRIEDLRAIKREVLADAPRPPEGFATRVAALATRVTQAPVLDLADTRRFLRHALIAAAVLAAVGLAFFAFEVLPDWIEPTKVYAEDPLLRR